MKGRENPRARGRAGEEQTIHLEKIYVMELKTWQREPEKRGGRGRAEERRRELAERGRSAKATGPKTRTERTGPRRPPPSTSGQRRAGEP